MPLLNQIAVARRPRTTGTSPKWLFLMAVLFLGFAAAVIPPHVLGQQPTEKPAEVRNAEQRQVVAKQLADEQKLVVKRLEAQVDELKQQAQRRYDVQRQLRSLVREKCGLSPENVMPVMLNLERDRFALEIEVKLKSARKKDLADTIAKETEIARQRGGDDEIADHLKQIVDVRQAAVAALEAARKVKGASDAEVKSAQADLAEAQIRLAQRKEELAKTHSEAAIDQLNRQLLDVSMAVTQDQLRFELLEERLKSLAQAEGILDEYQRVTESELPRILRLLDQAESRLADQKNVTAQ